MKFKLILFLIIIINMQCLAYQSIYKFVGNLNIQNKESNYILSFNRNQNKLVGFSYANIGTEDETKCSIIGNIDTVKEIIYLKEIDIVYTKSKLPHQQFCMLTITLKKSNQKKISIYKGTCKGYLYNTQSACATGILTMVDQLEATEKIKQIIPLMDTTTIKKIVEHQLPANLTTNEINQNLFQNDIHTLNCNSSSILLSIQDYNEMDYDKIFIEVNNEVLLANYTLGKQAKQLNIPLNSAHTLIKICALNEGNSAPNTALINIQSTSWSKSFISNLSTGACTTIDLKKD
jgi:hypothetical protein